MLRILTLVQLTLQPNGLAEDQQRGTQIVFAGAGVTIKATNADHAHGFLGATSGMNVSHTHSVPSLRVRDTAAAQMITIAGKTETRPQSKGVNYIIKY